MANQTPVFGAQKSAVNIACNSINVLCRAKGMMSKNGDVESLLLSNSDGKFRVVVPAAIFPFVVANEDDVLIIMSIVKAEAHPIQPGMVLDAQTP